MRVSSPWYIHTTTYIPGVRGCEVSEGLVVHVAPGRDPLDQRLGDLRVHEEVPVRVAEAAEVAADVGGDEVGACVRQGKGALHRLARLGSAFGHF